MRTVRNKTTLKYLKKKIKSATLLSSVYEDYEKNKSQYSKGFNFPSNKASNRRTKGY